MNFSAPFHIPNVRLFVAFRILFNSRFYYPIFTILFLDYGLTIAQFAVLNAAWAASIVLLEVPSGALADTFGRRNLLVLAAALMVLELVLIGFVPLGNSTLIFSVFLLNRILSGAAEAAASGADEALAYDSLAKDGDTGHWSDVLAWQMRGQAVGFMLAMSIGAAIYDPELMRNVAGWFGADAVLTQQDTMRWPVYATLVLSLLCLACTLAMREVSLGDAQSETGTADPSGEEDACAPDSSDEYEDGKPQKGSSAEEVTAAKGTGESSGCSPEGMEIPAASSLAEQAGAMKALRLTLRTGKWILSTPFPFAVILFGMLFDHTIRMFITLGSQYYRVIHLPEAVFGLIGAGMSIMRFFAPKLAIHMADTHSPATNTLFLSGICFLGFAGISMAPPLYWGILPVALLMVVMHSSSLLVSRYLNAVTASENRATALSFRGLSYNVAYGGIGILYSMLLALLKGRLTPEMLTASGAASVEDAVFLDSLAWFPWYFLALLVVFVVWCRVRLRDEDVHVTAGVGGRKE